MTKISTVSERVVQTIKCIAISGSFGSGDFSASVGSHRFSGLNYATACALYESRSGSDASLVDDFRLELVRRNWGSVIGVSV